MAALDTAPFPLVEVLPVTNAHNEWVALCLNTSGAAGSSGALRAIFGTPDLLTAIAPLDCVLRLPTPTVLTAPILALLPANRVVLAVTGAALAEKGALQQLRALQQAGYRVLLDGPVPAGVPVPTALGSACHDCSTGAGHVQAASAPSEPHLALGVDSDLRLKECQRAGFTWFSGTYPLEGAPVPNQDRASRASMLVLLGLLARDADSYELELQLKQDPVLSFHLLKLVNSAAFSAATPIASFNQAITLLGRRQLQRWLQLLLYAREQAGGLPNLLLPLAAQRAAQLEALCKQDGGDRDAQDLAFITGVFSLLDRLFAMPMSDIVGPLRLPQQVLDALVRREGVLGQRLRLAESHPQPAALHAAGLDTQRWWLSQLHAYHWAIQVARNV